MTEDIISALASPADKSKASKSRKTKTKTAPASSFYATGQLASHCVGVKVEGMGELAFPLLAAHADALIKLSQPAQFGLGERTLLDKWVRDTHEISADKLAVSWDQAALATMLDAMRATLGLPANAQLVPHLHNLLIYESGQFFKPHQDSEKLDGMVASLVVVLPCAHVGGDLRIHMGEEKYAFVSENLITTDLQCVAFYADCRHELAAVKQGYRIGLTYNLVLARESANPFFAAAIDDPGTANPALDSALRRYFAEAQTSASNATGGAQLAHCLVYLLDHSYTEHSLRWHFLKGEDVRVARLFAAAAQRVGFTMHLALAEVHQTWSADGGRFGDTYGHYDDGDDECDEDNEDDEGDFDCDRNRQSAKGKQVRGKNHRALPAPEDLIDEAVTLSAWIDARGERETYQSLVVFMDQVALLTPLHEREPDDLEYEGYTGNAGQTLDYWYRRGAIVLWPNDCHVRFQWRLDRAQAMAALATTLAAAGNEDKVRALVVELGPLLFANQRDPSREDWRLTVTVSLYVQNSELARSLLERFPLRALDEKALLQLAQLQQHYGVEWCGQLLRHWATSAQRSSMLPAIDPSSFVLAANQRALDPTLTLIVVDDVVRAHLHHDHEQRNATQSTLNASHTARKKALGQIVQSCSALKARALSELWVTHVLANPALYPALDLAEQLLSLPAQVLADDQCGAARMLHHAAPTLRRALAKGPRQPGDWSVATTANCRCKHCLLASEFVRSESRVEGVFPLAEQHRDHVRTQLAALDLPLAFEVRKQGSPYKLVITKNASLFAQDSHRFERLAACCEALQLRD